MSFSLGGSSSRRTNTTATSGQTDPWDEAIPQLRDFLGTLGRSSPTNPGPNETQSTAITQLENNAAAGNPHVGDIEHLTNDLFATTSGAPAVHQGYDELNRRLTPTADGTNLNVANDPNLQRLLQMAGDDTAGRINSQFAGAGRDMSGINQQSVAKGVGQAQLPILVDQLNREKGRTDAAARTLFDANTTAETTGANLDRQAADLRARGIDTAAAGVAARDEGPSKILALEELRKKMPFDEMGWLAELLYGAAGLGNQSSGTSYSRGNQQSIAGGIGSART